VSDNLREVALPFLAVLHHDLEPEQTLEVQLDLSLPLDKTKHVSESAPYSHGGYYRVVDHTYQNAWFRGTAQLVDGSVIRWRVEDTVCVSKRRKRTPRGKIKFKTRHAKRSVVEVALALPVSGYHVKPIEANQRAERKISLVPGEKRNTIKLVRKYKSKSLQPIESKALIDAVAAAYACAVRVEGRAA
jgi:hypothetical protein